MDVELHEVRDFLAVNPPFDQLPDAVLDELPALMTTRYVRRGEEILTLGEPNDEFYVIRSGAIDLRDEGDNLVERAAEGSSMGTVTLVDGDPSTFRAVASEDTLVLVMSGPDWHRLAGSNTAFREFFLGQRRERVRGALRNAHLADSGMAVLRTRAKDMVRHAIVETTADASVREAARIMADRNVSSILVMDGPRILGIVTDRDLRKRVVAAGLDTSDSVSSVMTPDPTVVAAEAVAFEVLLLMMDGQIHHLPVVESGRPIGVITSTDLVRLEHANPVYLVRDIATQADVAGVAKVTSRLPQTVTRLVSQDATADDIGKVVTAVADSVVRKIIALAEADLGRPPVPYCWMVLGSQARGESALGSDQDNAIILADDAGPEGERYVAALAEKVVAGLEQCGYPRCEGDVMATNPRWRQSLSGWRKEFSRWLHEPTSDALLNAAIFFDARALAGDTTLFTDLYRGVQAQAQKSGRFLGLMAAQAVRHEPPLGFFRGFVLQKEGEHKDTLNLKWGGIGAVQETARVLALAAGSPAMRTHDRITDAANAHLLTHETATDLSDAYEFISYVRLEHQAKAVLDGRSPGNHVNPDTLSSLDRRHLRDAFGVVRTVQGQVAQRYPAARI
ncbi:DUF294 nucleotidyltransferase-like domain-containing protein [Piscicoccus intestinalis]|uniref:DUF294 nucleotidyltransferase-like domain-containing protein n=1 Tax=Piscicoccus intestinalis TaxID=746033 RepID=UPI000838DCA0|nr:DUF294 nucleotidyltransferase-like domain-containing protein [Piscicoccus intestinalis]